MIFAVMTCNRMYYAKNCIDSILKFIDMDRIRLLICDNCTIEKGFDEYLNTISNQHKSVVVKKFKDRTRNELYRAMNYAIKFCKKENDPIVNFIQDDYQYLFRSDKQLDDTLEIFKQYPKIVQVNHTFAWARKKNKEGKKRKFNINGTNYLHLINKRTCDSGLTRVAAYDKIGLYPSTTISWEGGNMWNLKKNRYKGKVNGEQWFGRQCRKRKWTRCSSCFPCQTMLFDCAYIRGNKRYGRYFAPPNGFYIEPFNEKQMKQLEANNKSGKLSYIEKMCKPNGWKPKTYQKHSMSKECHKI